MSKQTNAGHSTSEITLWVEMNTAVHECSSAITVEVEMNTAGHATSTITVEVEMNTAVHECSSAITVEVK